MAQDPRVAGSRLAVWSHGAPHPTEGASTVLFWHYVSGLRAAGFEVLSVVLAQPDNASPEGLREYERLAAAQGIEVFVCRAESFLEERRHTVRLRHVLGPAREAVARFRPDASFCLDLIAAWAARGTPEPRVVWLGDLRFQSLWYHALYAARERPTDTLRVPLALGSTLVWRRAYRRALDGAAAVIVSSKSSGAALGRMGIPSTYQPYPWPSEATDRVSAAAPPDLPTFLFLGTLGALGSRSGFHFLLRRLYPELVRRWGRGGFCVLIAGRGVLPGWAAEAIEDKPELVHLGFVDDLLSVLQSVHAALAPISAPVGNRSRILTALAAGTPVVAHANAARGNPDLVDGRTCYLAADAETFAERMVRCVDAPADAHAVAARGRELYQTHFRPDVAVVAAVDTLAAVLPPAATKR